MKKEHHNVIDGSKPIPSTALDFLDIGEEAWIDFTNVPYSHRAAVLAKTLKKIRATGEFEANGMVNAIRVKRI